MKEIHDLHVWNVTFGKPTMTCHLKVTSKPDYVLKQATIVCRKVGIYHSTIQVEMENVEYQINCDHNLHN